MTTTDLTTFKTPNLDQSDRNELITALQKHLDGVRGVTLAVSYHKVTSSKPRIAGKDYKKVLLLTSDKLEGTIKKVAKGKNGWYVLMDATLTRTPLDGEGKVDTTKLGWTSIKGEGIDALLGIDYPGKETE